MAVEMISLALIDDNPHESRQVYHKKDIDELAESIKAHGLLQVPLARRKDGGRVELAFGQLRKRAYMKLAQDDPEKWSKMPVARSSDKVIEALDLLSDEPMAKLVVEFMLEMLRYKGDVETYRIETTAPLNWMGIGVTVAGEAL